MDGLGVLPPSFYYTGDVKDRRGVGWVRTASDERHCGADKVYVGPIKRCAGAEIMRWFAALMLLAGLGLPVAGCGGNTILTSVGAIDGGLNLADSNTEMHYNLSVADGSLRLTEIGSGGTVVLDIGLIDSVTGAHYRVAVIGGALTLVPAAETTQGTPQLGLADTVTARNYALAVVSGSLTLIPG